MTDIAEKQDQSDQPEALALFWQNVEALAAAFATVFKLVVAYLDRQETATLRGVNRAMRQAVNRTVTTVGYSPQTELLLCDPALVFSEASRLSVLWTAGYPVAATAEEADIVFNSIVESSPVLLQKIQSLSMQLVGMPANKSLAASMAEFLARCTTLGAVSITCGAGFGAGFGLGYGGGFFGMEERLVANSDKFHFKGQGSTPAEIRSHMQRQLAMMPSSPDFLAPTSWPACSCLTSLQGTFSSTDQDSLQQLAAAMQTTSLVSLHVTAADSDTCSSLPNVSLLCRLTNLHVNIKQPTATGHPPLLAAIASLTNLQSLVYNTSYEWDSPQTDVPHIWSQLKHVTQLHFTACLVDLRQVSVLPALQEVHLHVYTTPGGHLAALFPLTCLTALHCDDYQVAEAEQDLPVPSPSGAQQVTVPAAWRAGLRSLAWSCSDDLCIPVVAQLSSLVAVTLFDVKVTPAVCRAFGKLPHLERLTLWDITDPVPVPCPSIPKQLLPTLPSSPAFTLKLENEQLGALHIFARWTNIQRPINLSFGSDEADEEDVQCLSVTGFGANWLTSVLRVGVLEDPVPMVLAGDADVHALLAALPDATGADYMGPLWLGAAVSSAAFCRLVSCEHLPRNAISIAKPPEAMKPYVVGWFGGLVLTTAHLTELLERGPVPSLRWLTLEGCELLEDMGVVALAGTACGLTSVELQGAAKVGDAGLAALALGCPNLHSCQLGEASRVTAGGLRLVMMMAKKLKCMDMAGLGEEAAKSLGAEVGLLKRLGDSASRKVLDQWQVSYSETWTLFLRRYAS